MDLPSGVFYDSFECLPRDLLFILALEGRLRETAVSTGPNDDNPLTSCS